MTDAFDRCVSRILVSEGVLSDHPADKGGLTKYGITHLTHDQAIELGIVERKETRDLTVEEARRIYRRLYWDAARCSDLPEPLALFVFDCAVNQGVRTAVKLLQFALGVNPDGVMGPATLAAIAKVDRGELLVRLAERRWDRYAADSTANTFLRGWTFRLFRNLAESCLLEVAKDVP